MSDARAVFDSIYARKLWGEGSGGGSHPEVAAPYIQLVERLIHERKVTSVLDIGCGDGLLFEAINWQGATYRGIDCSEAAVKMAGSRGAPCSLVNAITDPLGVADLVLMKEVAQHLDNASIAALLRQLRRFPAVLHCSAVSGVANMDIPMGGTRTVDLSLPPFSEAAAVCLEYRGGETDYICQLWTNEGGLNA